MRPLSYHSMKQRRHSMTLLQIADRLHVSSRSPQHSHFLIRLRSINIRFFIALSSLVFVWQ